METRRENENLQTVIETLKQQNNNLQIEKDTEVEALSHQVGEQCEEQRTGHRTCLNMNMSI